MSGGASGYVTDALREIGARPFRLNATSIRRGNASAMMAVLCLSSRAPSMFATRRTCWNTWYPTNRCCQKAPRGSSGWSHLCHIHQLALSMGGHETSPRHYRGGGWAAQRYERVTGSPPKNRYGESLFSVSIREVLRWCNSSPNVHVLDAFPPVRSPLDQVDREAAGSTGDSNLEPRRGNAPDRGRDFHGVAVI